MAPPKTKPSASRGEPGVVAEQHLRAQGVTDLGDGRRGQRGLVGHHVAGHREPAGQPLGDLVAVLAGHPVGDHGEDVAAQAVVGAVGVAGLGEHGLGGLLAAADDGDHGRAELVGEPGVQGQLVGELGVGEIRTQDEDHVVVTGDQVETVDEGGDQLVRAALGLERGGLVVVHAVDGRRVLRQPVAGTQQLEQAVGPVVDEGTEDTHPVDLPGQELHDPQLHDLAAVAAVDAGHVHAARHVCSPFRLEWDSSRMGYKNRPPR
ncbi:hypothetical protein RKD49_005436 [Streptomyces glaucescens]